MVSDRFIKEVSARSSSISIFSFKERVYLFEWRLCNLNFSFILQDFFLQDFSSCSFKVEFFQYPEGSRLSLLHVAMLKDLVWLVLVSQHISTGHLVCTANKKTDCYRNHDTGLKRVRRSFTDSFRQFWSLTMNFKHYWTIQKPCHRKINSFWAAPPFAALCHGPFKIRPSPVPVLSQKKEWQSKMIQMEKQNSFVLHNIN